MTLGKRIAAGRKTLGLSQEALGGRLGVSRQAVSKWETDAAAPDMENLMALSRELGIPMPELTGTPEQPPRGRNPIQYFLLPVLCALAGAAAVGLFLLLGSGAPSEAPSSPPPEGTPEEAPSPAPATEFALVWTNGEGCEEFLQLGLQEDFFPFGTTLELTEPETVLDTDFSVMKHHTADCGAITIEYDRIEEDTVRESVTQLSTISKSVHTPRYTGPGSTEKALLDAYGDALVYCLKEEDNYSLIRHDHYYAYCEGPCVLLFYVAQGEVAGVKIQNLMDGVGLYDVDNIRRFPVVNGEPDFSLREEPEREPLSDARKVYIAFNQLATNDNLSAEERYAYRRDVFGLLPGMDWQEYGLLGEADDVTNRFALMDFLASQEAYSPSEMLWLQMGCAAPGLDGAYTDMYCHILSRALFYDPVEFSKQLAVDGIPEETMSLAISFAAYDADYFPVEEAAAVKAIEEALESGGFTESQAQWAERLVEQLTAE